MKSIVIRVCNKIVNLLSSNKASEETIKTSEYIQGKRVVQWFKDEGDKTHRLNYNLDENSLVWDLGGYEGQWASDIYGKYSSSIMIFEPYIPYANNIKHRFEPNKKIQIFAFGLGARTEKLGFSVLDNSSSLFANGPKNETIDIVSVVDFIKERNITSVDLVKINIEGGEYDFLEKLIESGLIGIFKNIQVQFHDFIIDNAQQRMNNIQKAISLTHKLTYQYEFVWENWEKIDK